ncbi:MAG: DNA polymerase domain-containing protein [Haloarculaceae archaeon]
MAFAFEFDDGTVREWHTDGPEDVRCVRNTGYTPSIYVDTPQGQLDALRKDLALDPKVVDTAIEERFLSLGAEERRPVLRLDVERMADLTPLARELKHTHERERGAPGTYRLYNVDLAPQFRYAVDTGTSPVPERDLSLLHLDAPTEALADGDLAAVEIEGEPAGSDPADVLQTVHSRVARADPDVLVCSSAQVVPLLFEEARKHGLEDFQLGRLPGYEQLAAESTFESYGQVGHSPARYSVPGRVILDRSNSFLLGHSSLAGLLDLVERSWKPLQEVGWASIGNVLTAIQIREALNRDVLVPWNKWEPEAFKDVHTLHAADRGGFTFQPDVGLHEEVVEVDFASLYPRIICEHNISPETILCNCHPDREDVPELDYNVCERDGFLPEVLRPLLEDREGWKAELADLDAIEELPPETRERAAAAHLEWVSEIEGDGDGHGDRKGDPDGKGHHADPVDALEDRRDVLAAKSSAIKWILVSCFGYQGYRNSKFGRIECHEAINAVARDVLLTAKEHAERNGWRVVHGIVDSLWLTPVDENHAPLAIVTDAVSAEIDITLEQEARYDWVAFVPRRDADAGALTKYVGKVAGKESFKVRGIEARQRSTPAFVADVQRELLDVLDEHRAPEPVVDALRGHLADLQAGRVDPADLVITKRVSQRLAEYSQSTRTVAALRRYQLADVERSPGQDVHFVVVDDDARGRERVRLPFEAVGAYDADFYATLLVRACESVVSPLGWDRTDVRRYLTGEENYELSAFG